MTVEQLIKQLHKIVQEDPESNMCELCICHDGSWVELVIKDNQDLDKCTVLMED